MNIQNELKIIEEKQFKMDTRNSLKTKKALLKEAMKAKIIGRVG
jgi:hypothetical protein